MKRNLFPSVLWCGCGVAFDIVKDTCEEYRMGPAETYPLIDLQDPAKAPVTVRGPRRTYALGGLLAEGDIADVHLGSAGEETWYALKISRVPEGHVFLDNERRALTDLLGRAVGSTYRKYLPELVESFTAMDHFRKRVNVFRHESGSFTLTQVHERHPALDGRHLAWIFKRLLTGLGFSHAQGRVHGAVLPCHVLLHAANHGARLVGWGQSVLIGRHIQAISTRYRDWYPPEVLGKQPASGATDVFMAARCMTYLAGGCPLTGWMPDTVPEAMRRFIEGCLLEGVRMRPGNAWKLVEEFDELLGRLYGPPRFHELNMN